MQSMREMHQGLPGEGNRHDRFLMETYFPRKRRKLHRMQTMHPNMPLWRIRRENVLYIEKYVLLIMKLERMKNEFSTFVKNEHARFMPSSACTISTPYICGDLHLCKVCGRCIRVCPKGLIERAGSFWHSYIAINDAEKCIGCKQCVRVCPYGVFSEKIFKI